jgi:hypothetical protein
MTKPRMDPSAFVGKLLEEQDADVLREDTSDQVVEPNRKPPG